MCCVISILTISNISFLIAPVQFPIHIYILTGHVITGDLKIIVFDKGPKYREPKSIKWKHNFKILMDSFEDYARQWAKREKENLVILSEWVKSVRSLIQIRIKKTQWVYDHSSTPIFKDPNIAKQLSLLHDKYVTLYTDKAPKQYCICV